MTKPPKTPKVTFVGGKWYDEHGKQVPKPQSKPVMAPAPVQGELQRYDDATLHAKIAHCTCARYNATGHVPGCLHFADALYVCEQGDRQTIAALAKLAETTISDLERRRIDFLSMPPLPGCPDRIPQADGRRRCMACPYWTRHPAETPFDHQPKEA